MKPYYEHGGMTIYLGDCREILPTLEPVDLVLTDPPYGIGYRPDYGNRKMPNGSWMMCTEAPAVIGDDVPFDPEFLLIRSEPLILWGANHYASRLNDNGRWIVWDKRCQIIPQRCQSDCEMAWCSEGGVDRIFYHIWDGMVRDTERGETRVHPTQKPIALMRHCLSLFPDAHTVLDPFMGSGTTLRAAKDLGRKAIGIEIEERYCEIAAKRLQQEVLDFGEKEKAPESQNASLFP